jgi:hypothetical protein
LVVGDGATVAGDLPAGVVVGVGGAVAAGEGVRWGVGRAVGVGGVPLRLPGWLAGDRLGLQVADLVVGEARGRGRAIVSQGPGLEPVEVVVGVFLAATVVRHPSGDVAVIVVAVVEDVGVALNGRLDGLDETG